jgi:predicted transcriptional regulator
MMYVNQSLRRLYKNIPAGTMVEVVKEWDENTMICLVDGERVSIRKEFLSTTYGVQDSDQNKELINKVGVVSRKSNTVQRPRVPRPDGPKEGQGSLFGD